MSRTCVRRRPRLSAGWLTRRSYWFCQAAGEPRSNASFRYLARGQPRRRARGPVDLVCRQCAIGCQIRAGVAGWAIKPRIVTEPAEKWAAFRSGARGTGGFGHGYPRARDRRRAHGRRVSRFA